MNRNELLKKREEKLEEIEELKAEVKEIEEEINKLSINYESIIILNTNTTAKELAEIKAYMYKITNHNKSEELGIKKLAYEIQGNKEGFYYIIYFEGNEEMVKELERYYRIKDEIMKFITIRTDY